MSGNYSDAPPPLEKLAEVRKEEATLRIMQLAIYGATVKHKTEKDIYDSLEDVLKLFKDAGFIL